MAITYQFRVEGETLLVETSGFDESLEEIQSYQLAIFHAAQEHHCRRVLCDESQLEYLVGTMVTFEAAEFIADLAPLLVRIAIVCQEHSLDDASFFETVVFNRGLQLRFFTSVPQARAWLES